MFIVSVTVSVCFESNGPCALELHILDNVKLPIPLCDFSQGFKIPGMYKSFVLLIISCKLTRLFSHI